MKYAISEMKHTLEGNNRRLNEVEDWISELKDRVAENTQLEQQKEKRIKKNDVLRDLWDNKSITTNEIEAVIKKLPTKESPELMASQVNCVKHSQKM